VQSHCAVDLSTVEPLNELCGSQPSSFVALKTPRLELESQKNHSSPSILIVFKMEEGNHDIKVRTSCELLTSSGPDLFLGS
jgi:hypothetical protein